MKKLLIVFYKVELSIKLWWTELKVRIKLFCKGDRAYDEIKASYKEKKDLQKQIGILDDLLNGFDFGGGDFGGGGGGGTWETDSDK